MRRGGHLRRLAVAAAAAVVLVAIGNWAAAAVVVALFGMVSASTLLPTPSWAEEQHTRGVYRSSFLMPLVALASFGFAGRLMSRGDIGWGLLFVVSGIAAIVAFVQMRVFLRRVSTGVVAKEDAIAEEEAAFHERGR
jgi:hypothetical protein